MICQENGTGCLVRCKFVLRTKAKSMETNKRHSPLSSFLDYLPTHIQEAL